MPKNKPYKGMPKATNKMTKAQKKSVIKTMTTPSKKRK